VVCGAKRIRSLYLPSLRERPPGLSTTSPLKGPASLSAINDATMRLCKGDLPAASHPLAAGNRSHEKESSETRSRSPMKRSVG
jgi:hypothetical protein